MATLQRQFGFVAYSSTLLVPRTGIVGADSPHAALFEAFKGNPDSHTITIHRTLKRPDGRSELGKGLLRGSDSSARWLRRGDSASKPFIEVIR